MPEWTFPIVEGEVEYRALREHGIVTIQHRRQGTTAWFELATGRWSDGRIVDLPYTLPGMAQMGLELKIHMDEVNRSSTGQTTPPEYRPKSRLGKLAFGVGTAAVVSLLLALELRSCAHSADYASVNVTIDGGVDELTLMTDSQIEAKARGACSTIGNNRGDKVEVVVKKRSGERTDVVVFDCEFGPIEVKGR